MPESFSWLDTWPGSECKVDVQEQGSCGACYAFASTSMLAERLCILNKQKGHAIEPKLLSAQFLVSCDSLDYGCQGGHLPKTMDFLST